MLKGGALPPTGRFSDLALLEPVRHYKARHGSVMLVFEALEKAMTKIEHKPTLGGNRDERQPPAEGK
jgi:NifU-like protein involved in Fe-S cluster formation